MRVFDSLAEAIRQGYEVYDRMSDGYIMRTKTAAGYALALAKEKPELRELQDSPHFHYGDPEC